MLTVNYSVLVLYTSHESHKLWISNIYIRYGIKFQKSTNTQTKENVKLNFRIHSEMKKYVTH
jgi:hypothetical protein